MLRPFLSQLLQELKIDDLDLEELAVHSPSSLEETHTISLPLNPQLVISLQELQPGVLFSSPLAPCPTEKREQLFMLLMKANFLGQGTGGGVIGLDQEERSLTFFQRLPFEMTYKMFKEALEDFANYLDYWREEVSRYAATTGLFT